MPVPVDGFKPSEAEQANKLRLMRRANYESSLNYSFLNLYAAQNYGNPNNVSAIEDSIDREFGIRPKLFKSETIQEFRANYEPGHRPVSIPQKPQFPNPKEHVIYQPVEKTAPIISPPVVPEEKYEPIAIPTPPEEPVIIHGPPAEEYISYEIPEEESFERPREIPQGFRDYPVRSLANGIPQFKNIDKADNKEISEILRKYYRVDISADEAHTNLVRELKHRQDLIKAQPGIDYPNSKKRINLAGNYPSYTGKGLRKLRGRGIGDIIKNKRKILAGEIGAGNDNPDLRSMIRQLDARKLKKTGTGTNPDLHSMLKQLDAMKLRRVGFSLRK